MTQLKQCLAFLLAAGTCALPQVQAQEGMNVDHVSKMERAFNATLSPDGRYIAYQVTESPDPMKKNARSNIKLHLYDTEDETVIPFYTRGNASEVTFRPGHNTLTFLASQEGDNGRALYEMPLDGGGPAKLMGFKRSIQGYDFGPEGNRIVFTAKNPKTGGQTDLPYKPELFEEGMVNTKAFVANLENEDMKPEAIQAEGTIYTVRFSPSGNRIAYSIAPTPKVDDYYMKKDVQIASFEDQEVLAELKHDGKLADIRWSPDGDQIALLAGNDIHDVIAGRIMVSDAEDGAEVQNIKPDFKGKFEQIRWHEEGEIHFLASKGTERGYGVIEPGSGAIDYTYEPGESNLMYQEFSRNANDKVAFVVTTPNHPREIYYKDGSGTPERITNSNEWMNDLAMGDQSVVNYQAEDGKDLEGILIKPVGYDGGEVPLIVVAHGGPESHYSNGWLTRYIYPGQVAAAQGYAVFYPNYRGSTGYGIDFLKSSQGDAAGKEFDDIVDGVDHLIDEGIANEDKVGITGGSYGGYATGWMATKYSDRFAAGVMSFGISDNISKWGTTDIPMEMYLVHNREWIYEGNWMKYLKRSPIYHVDKAQTPLLITHGKEDTRVHPGQSMELYRHLKVRKPDVPVRWVRYPGEGHGYGRSTSQYDYNIRMMRWFDHFLKGDGTELPARMIDDAVPENN
jgi:dipeptidyl aminopeptidase/acylaminoacyl peptidase